MTVQTAGGAGSQKELAASLSQKKIPSLDGLRAVAVILVILNHLNVPFAPEGRGVLTFFVLSGFLITWMMLKESEKNGDISIRNFYVRRVLRIVPAFYVFLVVQLAAQLVMRGRPSGSMIADYVSAFSFTSNYRFALTPEVDHSSRHTWALAIEEQFYLLWPLPAGLAPEGFEEADLPADRDHRSGGRLSYGAVFPVSCEREVA